MILQDLIKEAQEEGGFHDMTDEYHDGCEVVHGGKCSCGLYDFIRKLITRTAEATYKAVRPEGNSKAVNEWDSGYKKALTDLDNNYREFTT